MISKNLYIDAGKHPKLLDAIRSFAENRGYVLRENADSSMFAIYNKKIESSLLINMLDAFVGRRFFPQRVRLTVKLIKRNGYVEASIKGDVMLPSWDIVDDRPKRMDAVRCESLFNELVKQIAKLQDVNDMT